MRVISLVPSLTETLAECGVNLVARTRFCVHPAALKNLPAVGGTKDLDRDKLAALKPDLLVLDKEENLPWMKDEAPCRVHVFHATDVTAMPEELRKLADQFFGTPQSFALEKLAADYERLLVRPRPRWDFESPPGLIASFGKIQRPPEKLIYVIWKKPWMRVAEETYIHSVLEELGAGIYLLKSGGIKYPEFHLRDFDLRKTFFLFSSEPYPFTKDLEALKGTPGLQGALVDGEGYSWFGSRGLRFLEKYKV